MGFSDMFMHIKDCEWWNLKVVIYCDKMQVGDGLRDTGVPAQHDIDMMDSTLNNSMGIQSKLGMIMFQLSTFNKAINSNITIGSEYIFLN